MSSRKEVQRKHKQGGLKEQSNYMPKIIYTSEEDLQQKYSEALHILHNLRFCSKYWNKHYGFEARKWMTLWEERADKLLDSVGLIAHNNLNIVKIEPVP